MEPTLSDPSSALWGGFRYRSTAGYGARAMGLISVTSSLALGKKQTLIARACCWMAVFTQPYHAFHDTREDDALDAHDRLDQHQEKRTAKTPGDQGDQPDQVHQRGENLIGLIDQPDQQRLIGTEPSEAYTSMGAGR